MADVLEIVAELFPNIVQAAVIRAVDLGPPRDAGQDALPALVFLYLFAQRRENRWLLRAGTHDVHVADQHVPELRQLVQPERAQHASQGSHARIVALRPDLWRRPAVDSHRAELVYRERPATVVGMAPEVAGRFAQRAPIETDPLLREQHRTVRREFDQDGDDH